MYSCPKFWSIWRTSDFGTKLAPKHFNDKIFEKNKAYRHIAKK